MIFPHVFSKIRLKFRGEITKRANKRSVFQDFLNRLFAFRAVIRLHVHRQIRFVGAFVITELAVDRDRPNGLLVIGMRLLMSFEIALGVGREAAVRNETFLNLRRLVVQLNMRLQIALHRASIFAVGTLCQIGKQSEAISNWPFIV